jgi:predicted NBD/HSP70 family sugar kinase
MHKTYIGMDIHKNFIQATAMDEKGNILKEKRFSSDLQVINDFIKQLNCKDIQAAIESTCTWLSYI